MGGKQMEQSSLLPPPGLRYRQFVADFVLSRCAATQKGREHGMSFFEPDAKIMLWPAPKAFDPQQWIGVLYNTYIPSFLDWKVHVFQETYKEVGNRVYVDCQMMGTHTGAPFTFPPGMNQPGVQATGRYVETPVQPFMVEMSPNGKIQKLVGLRTYDGRIGGPLGMYLELGGKWPETKNFIPTAQKMMNLLNQPQCDQQGVLSMFAPDAEFWFKGAEHPLTPAQFCSVMLDTLRGSFPDFQVTPDWSTVQEIAGQVTFEVQAAGTFNGKPYSVPMAGAIEPLQPNGKKWKISRERVVVCFDQTNKITRVDVNTVDNTPTGPVGAYLALGGKLTLTPQQLHGNIMRQGYDAFMREDLPFVMNLFAPNCEALNGEDDPLGTRKLPFAGRWNGIQGVLQQFMECNRTADVLKFHPRLISTPTESTVLTIIDCIMKSKKNGKVAAIGVVHEMEFDANHKIIRFKEYGDYSHLLPLYE
jgi:ketosteroid isomerase-like protein